MHSAVLYNLTFKLSQSLSQQWLDKMLSRYIPESLIEQFSISVQINEILINSEDGDSSFAVQFTFSSINQFESDGKVCLKKLLSLMDEDFRNNYVYFGTLMNVIHPSNQLPTI